MLNSCCTVFCWSTGVILCVFSALINGSDSTFAVIAAKHDWDVAEKARCCLVAGVAYFVVGAVFALRHMAKPCLDRWCGSRR